jgi:hypothetical protein
MMVQTTTRYVVIALIVASLLAVSMISPKRASSDPDQPQPYTGILIDARQLPDITRSMNPGIYGPAPTSDLIYPDRSHVPTPDQVQDESTARYYRSLADAENGVAGSNPMIIEAVSVVGYAKDSLTVTADDEARIQALDKQLHFTQTWKFGILVPPDK